MSGIDTLDNVQISVVEVISQIVCARWYTLQLSLSLKYHEYPICPHL